MVAILVDHQFSPVTNLKNLGISFSIEPGANPADFEYSSIAGVKIAFKAAGQAPLQGSNLMQADAGISVEFDRENAIVFHLLNCTSQRITDQVSLKNEIIRRYDSKNWDKLWLVVTEVIRAEKGTIIIGSTRNSRIEINLKGTVGGPVDNLANISTNNSIVQNIDVNNHWIAEHGLTPMFKAYGITRKFLGLRRSEFNDSQYMKDDVTVRMEIDENSITDFIQLDYDNFTDWDSSFGLAF